MRTLLCDPHCVRESAFVCGIAPCSIPPPDSNVPVYCVSSRYRYIGWLLHLCHTIRKVHNVCFFPFRSSFIHNYKNNSSHPRQHQHQPDQQLPKQAKTRVCVYVCRSVCVCELPCNDTTNTQGSNRMRRFTDFRKPISVFTAKYFYFLISDDVFLLFFIRFSSLGPPFCMFAFAVHFSFVLHFVHFHVSDVSPLCVCVVSRVRAHDTRCSPLN